MKIVSRSVSSSRRPSPQRNPTDNHATNPQVRKKQPPTILIKHQNTASNPKRCTKGFEKLIWCGYGSSSVATLYFATCIPLVIQVHKLLAFDILIRVRIFWGAWVYLIFDLIFVKRCSNVSVFAFTLPKWSNFCAMFFAASLFQYPIGDFDDSGFSESSLLPFKKRICRKTEILKRGVQMCFILQVGNLKYLIILLLLRFCNR